MKHVRTFELDEADIKRAIAAWVFETMEPVPDGCGLRVELVSIGDKQERARVTVEPASAVSACITAGLMRVAAGNAPDPSMNSRRQPKEKTP